MIGKVISAIRIVLSTAFYLGYIPQVQRLLVSALVVVLLWLFRVDSTKWFTLESLPLFLVGSLIYVVVASWLCDDTKKNFGDSVPTQVVLDYAGGQLFSFFLISHVWSINPSLLALGFVGYNFFSIVKPWPVFHFEEVTGGFGLVLDDLAAGAMTAVFIHALVALHTFIMPIIS